MAAVQKVVQSIDPDQPVFSIQTFDQVFANERSIYRIFSTLFAVLAAIGLTLSAVGIYGVMSYSVSARTQEMGIRFALGAQRGSVLWLVMRQVLLLAAAGLAIGLGLLVFGSRGLEGLLFGVDAIDPATIAVVAAALASVGLAAAWFPAARASRVDPVDALRYE